ncbi:MAG: UDP-N-acetylmuramoyl-tripeptide--D-alanyl-D-alanine ligase [Verrucomicrobia bacterium]|nr:UDP-N-acetylmuramoyl-tripeptide--D-alanyl-D-alanine ligase [Verrucomicrobiota bacterium]
MDPLPLHEIAEFAGARIDCGDRETVIERVSTDSRSIEPGDLFVALRGDNFDGHAFLRAAISAGAAAAMVEDWCPDDVPPDFPLLAARNSLQAYGNFAAKYRKSLPLKVLAITGSNGKTSTKDFAASILAREFRVLKTEGNFNNYVGVPRTMLEASRSDEIAVVELGMNHPGEIASLARIASPDAAIITNIGIAHIEFMGSREAIAQEKGALAEAVGAAGFVVLNGDDEFTPALAKRTGARVIMAGINNGELRAIGIEQSPSGCEFTIIEGPHRCRARLPVPGLHMVQNALLAVAAARQFGMSLEDCAAGLAAAPLTKGRLQIREIAGVRFIDDSYNANPDSMKAALRTLAGLETSGKRVAVLGQMLELGTESERGHREAGETAAALGIDHLIAIANKEIAAGARDAGLENVHFASNTNEAAEILHQLVSAGDLVLVKGSRVARTEQVIEQFSNQQSAISNSR